MNMVTEKKDVIAFDGDGHPVVEKSGYQNYHAVTGTPPPANWQPPIRSYQIWSTVLGGSLMTYHPANDYRAVNVYAGGAVIAEKTRSVENNQTVEHTGWKTSDPVTGTQAVFNQYGAVKLEEIEPLGQAIAFHDSSAPPEPSPNQVPERRNADDPHWQCEADKGFWGGFTGYPFHCQKKMIQDLDYELKNLFGWGKRVENPARINYLTDSPLPSYGMPHSAADNVMAFALRATTKKTGIEGGSSDGCKFDKNGNKTCGVNVPIPPLDMSVIPGFVDASVGGGDEKISDSVLDSLRGNLETLLNDKDCGTLINNIFKHIELNTNPFNPGEKFEGSLLENFDRIRNGKGFWLSDTVKRRAENRNSRIIFGNWFFTPDSTTSLFYYIIRGNFTSTSRTKINIPNSITYEITDKMYVILTLVHELLHSPYKQFGLLAAHDKFTRATVKALEELGITSNLKNLKSGSSVLDAALVENCGKVKL